MQQTNIPISSLVEMYKRRELALPAIQRRYVWEATKVRDLLDSLYRGYPSGSILMWETDENVALRESAISQAENTPFARKLLLDGQQRLTSLTSVLNGEAVTVRGRSKKVEILFNLEHPDGPPTEVLEVPDDEETGDSQDGDDDIDSDDVEEEESGASGQALVERLNRRTFVVYSRNLAAQPNWVKVSEVFSTDDAAILKKSGIRDLDDPRYLKYSERLAKLRRVKNYEYVVHVLERDMNYEEVTEIFVRVNSRGAKLRSSDLAMAQISSRWTNLLEELQEFQDECEENWFTLDHGTLVRTIAVMATTQCKFRSIGSISVDKLQKSWKDAKEGLRFAINFLRTRAGIEDESLLSSPFLIVLLAAAAQHKNGKLTEKEQKQLLRWLFIANARSRYGRGSSESLLNEDLAIIYRGAGISGLLEPLKAQFGRLDLEISDIKGKRKKSPIFSLAYLALKDRGAKDWMTGLGLSLVHQGKNYLIQHHHIFPKSKLARANYEENQIHEIANFAFIGGGTNREITNKDPIDYFPKIVKKQGEEVLTAQLVPLDPELWEIKNYEKFLEVRRAELITAMNGFIEKKCAD
jgi:hypothetical protein